MKNREKYNLRMPLFAWSLGLCLFSSVGVYMAASQFIQGLMNRGFYFSVCEPIIHDGAAGLWSFLFVLSKAPELVDTYFIVLRKQKLIFLHWYHHVTVFIYCWYHYGTLITPGQWFVSMNYIVHSVMYGYYAVRASHIVHLPKWVNIFITSLQLIQMFIGITINIYIYSHINTGWYCDGRVETTYFYVYISFAMYFSYFVLFAHFFYVNYICVPTKPTAQNQQDKLELEHLAKTNGNLDYNYAHEGLRLRHK